MKIQKIIVYEWDDEKFVKKEKKLSIQYSNRNILILYNKPLYKVYYGSMKNTKIEKMEVMDNIDKDTVLIYLKKFPKFVINIFLKKF